MKLFKFNSLTVKSMLFVFATLMLFSFFSCTRKVNFTTSSVVPAARGYVKVKKDKNENYNINVVLSNLAEVKRLDPSKQTYMVWMDTSDETAKSLGQIKSSTRGLAQKLKASFTAVSASKPHKVYISAESDENTEVPSTQIVLTTDKF